MLSISKADVWAATCEDRPGGLMGKLEGLAKAGANLQFILARRMREEPGKAAIFLTPLRGEAQETAAERLGFKKTHSLHTLRIEGPDEPGLGYLIVRALASEQINLRGTSASVIGNQFVMYLDFDAAADADRAMSRLERPL